jgi:hypothetical protein
MISRRRVDAPALVPRAPTERRQQVHTGSRSRQWDRDPLHRQTASGMIIVLVTLVIY